MIKKPGDSLSINLALLHSGPTVTGRVYVTLAPKGIDLADPIAQPANHRFTFTVDIPAHGGLTGVSFPTKVFGVMPSDFSPGQVLDVNVAVGPDTEESFSGWYSKRWADDWDRDAYQLPELPKTVVEIDDAGTVFS